ncbi:MAG: radical SAM protein [Rhodospirillaceae bacterium]|nr:radical SAM protein [Rhodospirillaceae bacterium]
MDIAEAPFLVALNLTRRCNLACAHCYLDANARKDGEQGELTTDEVKSVIDDIANLSDETMVVLTGGEPMVRRDLEDLVAHATKRGLMPVIGTNGTLLTPERAARLKEAGLQGMGISLDSLNPAYHDEFRGQKGSWLKAMAAIDQCRKSKIRFQIHFSVTDDNAHELDDMIAFAKESKAFVLNVFFLVCTGRGEKVTNISRETYDDVLRKVTQCARDEQGLIVRAKCAPHFKRMALELDPEWPVTAAHGYEAGGCLAGTRYARVTPEGDVTPCPYMEQSVGNVRSDSFSHLWQHAEVFQDLRAPKLEGRCGACEYAKLCGGCRARPLARDGNMMGEDFLCAYEPKGGAVIEPMSELGDALVWTAEAEEWMKRIPSFVRRFVRKRAEDHVRTNGGNEVTADIIGALARERFKGRGGGSKRMKQMQEFMEHDNDDSDMSGGVP